jgi:hypothetical protein
MISEEDNTRLDKARALAILMASDEIPPLEEVIQIMEHWRDPRDLIQEIMFDITHGWLYDTYGEYWLDPRTPWIPT